MDDAAGMAVERIARLAYGKLLAMLAVRSRTIAAAEDALGEALLRALSEWRRSGVPANPEAWIVTVARRIDADRWRRTISAASGSEHWLLLEDERSTQTGFDVPDDRLRMLLVCAHPAIDPEMHAPLMLQTALGLDARKIASAFLVSPATMGQRLSRAKARIADAGLRFEFPDHEALSTRIDAVLSAIYAAYSLGWDLAFVDAERSLGLVDESLWLTRLVLELSPEHSEARALLALMLFAEARRPARRDHATGAFVPLSDQDTRRWNNDMIAEAERALRVAGQLGGKGRFGFEAAIQAVQASRRITGAVDWATIEYLYRGLLVVSPTIGARIGHAVAVAEAGNPDAAHLLLDGIEADRKATHQPYWVALAHVCALRGEIRGAKDALERGIGLTEDVAVRRFLMQRLSVLLDQF